MGDLLSIYGGAEQAPVAATDTGLQERELRIKALTQALYDKTRHMNISPDQARQTIDLYLAEMRLEDAEYQVAMMNVAEPEKTLSVGDWVYHGLDLGVVDTIPSEGRAIVALPNGGQLECAIQKLRLTTPTEELQTLKGLAGEYLGWTDHDFWIHHLAAANLKEPMSFPVIAELKTIINDRCHRSSASSITDHPLSGYQYVYDPKGAEVFLAVENSDRRKRVTYTQLENAINNTQESEPVHSFLVWLQNHSQPIGSARSGGGTLAGRDSEGVTDQAVTDFFNLDPQKLKKSRSAGKPAGGTSSPAKDALPAEPEAAPNATLAGVDIFGGFGLVDCQPTPENAETEPESAPDAIWETIEQTAALLDNQKPDNSGLMDLLKAQSAAAEASLKERVKDILENEPVMDTDAGLIDPETGEVVEQSLILAKLDWTEMPSLRKDATKEEVEAFEQKVDQVVDRVLSHRERAARKRASCEKEVAPIEKAADFWEQFSQNLARQLAPHRLKVIQRGQRKGEYSSKTFYTASGAISFTQSGGYHVHDKSLVLKHIQEKGIAEYKETLGAKYEVTYSYNKLLSALKKGVVKDIPGTGFTPVNPLAKMKIVSPSLSATADQTEGEDNDD